MNIVQTLRRLSHIMTGWKKALSVQSAQMPLIKKLYARNGLSIEGGGACPEQYKVFKDGNQVGYYRLRHGEFRVDYPDCMEETIYEADTNGDGIFNDNERLIYLTKAMRKVIERINQESQNLPHNN